MSSLSTHRLLSADDPRFAECWALYEAAFPEAERRTLACQRAAMVEQGAFHCLRLEQGGVFAGIAFYWQADAFLYVEHLAVAPTRRGQGIGHLALEYLCAQGVPVILEIEPVVDEPTERRWRFYRSAGFHSLPYHHLQPLYHRADEPMRLTLLSYPHALGTAEVEVYEHFMRAVVGHYTEENLDSPQ